MRFLLVLFLYGCLHTAGAAEHPRFPAPPFPVINAEQTDVYHKMLLTAFPNAGPEEISDRIGMIQESMQRRAETLLTKGQQLYGLPRTPLAPIHWDFVCYDKLGEAWSDFIIRLSLTAALFHQELFERSVIPHEIAHVLFFQKYGQGYATWNANAEHRPEWEAIMRDLVGFSDNTYPRTFFAQSNDLAHRLLEAAGSNEQRFAWVTRLKADGNAIPHGNPAVQVPPFRFISPY